MKTLLPAVLLAFLQAAPQAAPQGETLTAESLPQFLTGMGYEPKKLSKGFLLTIQQDSSPLVIQVVISPNADKIGLNANLVKIENPGEIPAQQWLNLLISNGDIDPSMFYFDKALKKLFLHRSFDNRCVTPAVMKREIDNFAKNLRSTESLWSEIK